MGLHSQQNRHVCAGGGIGLSNEDSPSGPVSLWLLPGVGRPRHLPLLPGGRRTECRAGDSQQGVYHHAKSTVLMNDTAREIGHGFKLLLRLTS